MFKLIMSVNINDAAALPDGTVFRDEDGDILIAGTVVSRGMQEEERMYIRVGNCGTAIFPAERIRRVRTVYGKLDAARLNAAGEPITFEVVASSKVELDPLKLPLATVFKDHDGDTCVRLQEGFLYINAEGMVDQVSDSFPVGVASILGTLAADRAKPLGIRGE